MTVSADLGKAAFLGACLLLLTLAFTMNEARKARGPYRVYGSKYISVPQAKNLIEAVDFAKSIDLPLVAHLTIHWSGTVAFDDHEGARFAKVREGLVKVLLRRGKGLAVF